MRFNRELLKGNTGTVVLAILAEGPLHGYEIAKEMRRRSEDALTLGQGVLYPILHRLEAQGLIAGEWEQSTGTPSRKMYKLTARDGLSVSPLWRLPDCTVIRPSAPMSTCIVSIERGAGPKMRTPAFVYVEP